jgi:hypothetical protein
MSFEEMVVALVGAIGAFALVGYLATKIIDLIKAWVNRNSSGIPEENFNRLAQAFVEHKKETLKRLQNLEAIIAEEDSGTSTRQIEEPQKTIEIDSDDTVEEEKNKDNSSDGDLRNMLRE